jgi:hypothetical protein
MHVTAEVTDVEYELAGVALASRQMAQPTRIDQPVLVTGRVDRLHSRYPENPFELRLQKGSYEATRSGVNMHRNGSIERGGIPSSQRPDIFTIQTDTLVVGQDNRPAELGGA